ncbi:MAG TPA: flavodoxin family protein [Desulfuromonadales bacterium]|nr:flavodoxin family protein [Desulfuromonadales bacterium]
MKVLGISASPRPGHTTDTLVREVLGGFSGETEFISLSGKRIGPCIACLRCVQDNICKVGDDMTELRPKIVEADALVIGAPNYFDMINGLAHCFLERFYQFRHLEGKDIAGKPGVIVGVGGGKPESAVRDIRKFFDYNQIVPIGSVSATGPASCFTCGHGEDCTVGAIHMFFGAGTKITEEITPALSRQPESLVLARHLGRQLSDHLAQPEAQKGVHDGNQ